MTAPTGSVARGGALLRAVLDAAACSPLCQPVIVAFMPLAAQVQHADEFKEFSDELAENEKAHASERDEKKRRAAAK